MWSTILATLLGATVMVACTSSDENDPGEAGGDTNDSSDSADEASLAGDVVLARGGHADAAERCAYRGDDGTQIRLSSRASDQPIDVELAGDPVTLPNVDGADGAIRDDGSVVELTVVSPGERLSFIAIFSGDGDGDVDADTVIELAEEFLGLVG